MKRKHTRKLLSLICFSVFLLLVGSLKSYADTNILKSGSIFYTCPGKALNITIEYGDVTGEIKYKFSGCNSMTVTGSGHSYTIKIANEGDYSIVADGNSPFLVDYRFTIHVAHDYEEDYTLDLSPSCLKKGSKSIHCKRCNATTDVQEIPATGHIWEDIPTIDIEPTCTKEGRESIHCINCDAQKDSVAVKKLGHDLVHHEGKDPTYEENGWLEYDTCSRCDYTTFEEVPALPKTVVREVSFLVFEPAIGDEMVFFSLAEGEGYSVYDVIWEDESRVYTDDQNHVAFDKDKHYTVTLIIGADEGYMMPWNETEPRSYYFDSAQINGKTPRFVRTLGENNQFAVLSLSFDHTHSFKERIIIPPTCTTSGEAMYVCSVCQSAYNDVVEKTGHKWSTTDYVYSYDPNKCKIEDIGDGIHHKVTGSITKRSHCNRCEEINEEIVENGIIEENHNYDDDSVCTVCGYHDHKDDNTRIFGKARYDTAIEAADKYKEATGSKFQNVIVAYGRNFPDALAGGYLAKVKNAPILLVEPSEENRIADYIKNNIASGGKVYLLGGTGVVSSAFEKKVKNKGIETERLGGQTRFDTNLAILKEAGVKDEDILVCTGYGYADSLSASAVGKPILLVDKNLSEAQKEYIKGLNTKQFYLIGGEGVVSNKIQTDLKKLNSGYSVERLWGQSRYETSTAVAKKFFPKTKTVILAYAQNFPDGLSGGPLAMKKNAPIVLTDTRTTAAAKSYIKSAGAVQSITLGGPALISDIAVKAIMGR